MSRLRRSMTALLATALLSTGGLAAAVAAPALAATAPQARVTLLNTAVLAGQNFFGTIVATGTTDVTSATVSGPCVAGGLVTDTSPGTPGIQFTLPTRAESAPGTCTLAFVVTLADHSTETDSANLTIAPGTTSVGATVTQTVSGVGNAPVDIQLLDCADVSNTNGTLTFRGTQPGSANDVAVPSTNNAVLTAVNGTPTATRSNQANGVTPGNGSVTFTFSDKKAGECVTPVVFARGSGPGADQLPLGTDDQALVPVAIGTPTTVLPPPAPAGTIGSSATTPTALITAVAPPYFVITSAGTYIQRDTDVIQLYITAAGQCVTPNRMPGTGHRRLTPGDTYGGTYDPSPGGVSTSCLGDVTPVPPTTVTASQTSTTAGTTVTFRLSRHTETVQAISGFNVYRAPATPPASAGAPYTCPTSTPVPPGASPQIPPTAPYTVLTTVPATGAGSYSYQDTTASPGSSMSAPNAFCYAVSSLAVNEDGGLQVGTARPADASNPPPSTSGRASATAPAPEVPTAAPSFSCDQTISGPRGALTLGPGQYCITHAQLTGLTLEPGAAVSITDSQITGPIRSTGATYFRLCGSEVTRGVRVSDSTGPVLIGDTSKGCAANTLTGTVTVTGTIGGGVDVSDNHVAGSLKVTDNTGSQTAPRIAANVLTGSLSCAGNEPPPTDGGRPNTAASGKLGQCAGL